jgi:indole-3-glycerol phosphate synthase
MGGAAAISVLTEPSEFAGSLADLRQAARAIRLPILRKDFIVDPYQVLETRAAGGAGILIIVRLLDDARMSEILAAAAEVGVFVLLEAFDESDLTSAGTAASLARHLGVTALVGLNARNLQTLQTERDRLRRFCHMLPEQLPRVAESSLMESSHVGDAARCGYDIALVGSALMRSHDPARLLSAMIAAGRAERAVTCALA